MVRAKIILMFFLCCVGLNTTYAQKRDLSFFLEKASLASPLIRDLNNQKRISTEEQERLKAHYTRSRLEMNANYLFVPIINRDNGKTAFQWDAKDATDYYGYDSGVTSGEFKAGITWTKPLTGGYSYNMIRKKSEIDREQMGNRIRLEKHELSRAVTEQYLLCQSDLVGMEQSDSIQCILSRQREIIRKLGSYAMARQTGLQLIDIEITNNKQTASAFRQSYWNHLLDLNLLCGITDTTRITIEPVNLVENRSSVESQFLQTYRLDSLSLLNDFKISDMQYRPQLNIFVDGGLRTTSTFTHFGNRLGASAGITFSWLINDGGQKKHRYHQMQYQQETVNGYKAQKQIEIAVKRNACRKQLDEQLFQIGEAKKQLTDYEYLLHNYQREIAAGQLSVLDYITVLKSYIQQKKGYESLLINKELIVNALNYWNW